MVVRLMPTLDLRPLASPVCQDHVIAGRTEGCTSELLAPPLPYNLAARSFAGSLNASKVSSSFMLAHWCVSVSPPQNSISSSPVFRLHTSRASAAVHARAGTQLLGTAC